MRSPAQKATVRTVPVNQIPEVEAYVNAEDRLQQFIQANQQFMDELANLVDERNQALQDADGAVRAACEEYGSGINCGPFRFKHFTQKVNAEAMFDTLGKDNFIALSGAIKTVPKYEVEREVVFKAISSGQISAEQAANFYTNTPNYAKIQMVVLP